MKSRISYVFIRNSGVIITLDNNSVLNITKDEWVEIGSPTPRENLEVIMKVSK